MNKGNPRIFLSTIAVVCCLTGNSLQAQEAIEPDGPLPDVPGLTEPQQATANGIMAVCPTLVENMADLNAAQLNLQRICTAMVGTAADNQNITDSPALPQTLGIDDAQLREALQSIAHEETAAESDGGIEFKGGGETDPVGARLAALRAGATGLRLSSVQLNLQGQTFTAADLVGEGGGAAGDDEVGGPLGAFLNGSYYWGDKDASTRENAFDFDNYGVVGGVDYRITDELIAGVAVNYSQTNVDFDTGPDSETDTDTYGGSLYGTYYVGALYLDAHANYSRSNFDTDRGILIPSPGNNDIDLIDGVDDGVLRGTASGETDANQYTAGLGAGYDLQNGGLTTTPYGRLEYIDLDIDGYSETDTVGLALAVDDQSVKSLQSALGAQLAYALSLETGVLVPQVYAEWNHEFENDSEAITAQYVNDPFNLSSFAIPTEDPDEDFFTIGTSLTAAFREGLQAFVNFETVEGLSDISNRGVIGGVRGEF